MVVPFLACAVPLPTLADPHWAIAAAMSFADHSNVDLERLEAERRTEVRRRELEARRP